MTLNAVRLFTCACAISVVSATALQAQRQYPDCCDTSRSFSAGVYGGGVWPTESFDGNNFKRSVEPGWTGGGTVQIGKRIGLRADLSYVAFGKSKDIATLDAKTNVIAGTGAVSVDLGGLYLMGGAGWYRFDYKNPSEASIAKSHWGANAGFGIPLLMNFFVEGRGHVVFPDNDVSGNASFVTAAVGIRFR